MSKKKHWVWQTLLTIRKKIDEFIFEGDFKPQNNSVNKEYGRFE